MQRSNRAVGLIRCLADERTLNEIAGERGLTVEPAMKPNHFYLIDGGVLLVRELQPALFAAVAHDLDRAVQRGRIPPWSTLVRPAA